jgi:hypothetical protein
MAPITPVQLLGDLVRGGRLLSEVNPKYCKNAGVVMRKPGRPRPPKRGSSATSLL